MKKIFWFNKNINLSELRDSMQLDSGQTVATLETDSHLVTLEVRGDVRVLYNEDPDGQAEDGQIYKHASGFPESLLDIFKNGTDYSRMQNINVIDNNWLEIFLFKRIPKSANGNIWEWTGWSDVVDDGPFTEKELKEDLQNYLQSYTKENS